MAERTGDGSTADRGTIRKSSTTRREAMMSETEDEINAETYASPL